MNPPRPRFTWRFCDILAGTLVVGYICPGRSFAYLGIPPLFIGEIVFGCFLLFRFSSTFQPAFGALVQRSSWSSMAWTMYVSIGYGLAEVMRGLFYGHLPMVTIQNLVFHVYPLFVFVGLDVGRRNPKALEQLIPIFAWANGIYAVLYIAIFAPMGLTDQLSMFGRGLFGQNNWTAVTIIALVSYDKNWRRIAIPLLLNFFSLLAMQIRAEWLSLLVCLPLWGILSGRTREVVRLVCVLGMLLLVGLITDVNIPSPANRGGGGISTRELTARAVASVSPKLAEQISRDGAFYADTINWRTGWWKEIWRMAHETPERVVFGPGYGYPIWDLHPEGLEGFALRTPHNAIIYALGYTGWLGVVLLGLVQLAIVSCLWRAYLVTGQSFGLTMWVICIVRSQFDLFFESPHFAITFFLFVGLALAEQFAPSSQSDSREKAILRVPS